MCGTGVEVPDVVEEVLLTDVVGGKLVVLGRTGRWSRTVSMGCVTEDVVDGTTVLVGNARRGSTLTCSLGSVIMTVTITTQAMINRPHSRLVPPPTLSPQQRHIRTRLQHTTANYQFSLSLSSVHGRLTCPSSGTKTGRQPL